MNELGQVPVYVVLQTGKMIEVLWTDKHDVEDFDEHDAVEQCSQHVRAGEPVYGRLCGGDGADGPFRWFSVIPSVLELVFANAE
jgi:hypothetical protein